MPTGHGHAKTQLTMLDFKKRRASASTHPTPRPSSMSTLRGSEPLSKLPRPSAPPFFRTALSKPKKNTCNASNSSNIQCEDAWHLAQTIFEEGTSLPAHASSTPLNRRMPYGDDGGMRTLDSPQDGAITPQPPQPHQSGMNSDNDFQNGDASPRNTPMRRRRSAIRRPAPELRDDRPSMARRSSKKIRNRTDTYHSRRNSRCLSADAVAHLTIYSADDRDAPRVDHVLLKGDRSELSSETDEDRKEPKDVNVPIASLEITPVDSSTFAKHRNPDMETNADRLEETPIEFSLNGSAVQKRHTSVMAPRKHKAHQVSAIAPTTITTAEPGGSAHLLSGESLTRKRGRQLTSLFSSDSDVGSNGHLKAKERLGSSKCIVPDRPLTNRSPSPGNSPVSDSSPPSPPAPIHESGGSDFNIPSRVSTRKRRRIINLSTDDDEESEAKSPTLYAKMQERNVLAAPKDGETEDQFHTPTGTRRLLPPSTPNVVEETRNKRSTPLEVDNSIEIIADNRNCRRNSASPEVIRRRTRVRRKSRVFEVTSSDTPSPPPSTRRKGRLSRLETQASSENEIGKLGMQQSTADTKMITPVRRSVGVTTTGSPHTPNKAIKSSGWYDERDIGQFSSSSSEENVGETKVSISDKVRPFPVFDTLSRSSAKLKRLRQHAVKNFSDEVEDITGDRASIADTPTQSPHTGCVAPVVISDDNEGDGLDVLDLIDDGEEETASRHVIGSSNDVLDISRTDGGTRPHPHPEDTGIPPFDLHTLCNSGESIQQMVERLGEAYILERITNAQRDERKIIGGEELGLDEVTTNDVFSKFSKTVVASDMERIRPEHCVTEKALCGEFKFNYRGRNQEGSTTSGRWEDHGRGRGRGRGFRRRHGRSTATRRRN